MYYMRSEVFSWRLSPALKADLESEARRQNLSLARLLEHVATDWLKERRNGAEDDAAVQKRLHAAVERCIGTIAGDDPTRSSRVRELVRAKLAEKHGRKLPR